MTEEVETTLREDLEASLNQVSEPETGDNEETVNEEVETDEVEEETNEEAETDEEQPETEADDVEEVEQEETVLEAPEHWAADDRETFSAQNEDVKAYMLKRHNEMESGFTKKSQDLAEQRKSIEGLSDFVNKWEPHTSNLGVPLVTGLETLLNHDRNLRTGTEQQKTDLLLQIASQYGINLSAPSVEEDAYQDPQLKALQDQINTQNEKLNARDVQEQQFEEQRLETVKTEVQTAATTFADEKDDTGNLKYPHYETLRQDMATLIQSGLAGTGDSKTLLDAAYNKALYMNTATREQLLKNEQSSQKEKSLKKQSKAAAQAKKSAKANKRGTNVQADKPKAPVSLRDDIASQIKQANEA